MRVSEAIENERRRGENSRKENKKRIKRIYRSIPSNYMTRRRENGKRKIYKKLIIKVSESTEKRK